jgi:hypothetical protein
MLPFLFFCNPFPGKRIIVLVKGKIPANFGSNGFFVIYGG